MQREWFALLYVCFSDIFTVQFVILFQLFCELNCVYLKPTVDVFTQS